MIDGKYLNMKESAEYLGYSREWFYTIKKKYKLEPAAKIGNMALYLRSDLKKLKKFIADEPK